jgi:hypothetical protein
MRDMSICSKCKALGTVWHYGDQLFICTIEHGVDYHLNHGIAIKIADFEEAFKQEHQEGVIDYEKDNENMSKLQSI